MPSRTIGNANDIISFTTALPSFVTLSAGVLNVTPTLAEHAGIHTIDWQVEPSPTVTSSFNIVVSQQSWLGTVIAG